MDSRLLPLAALGALAAGAALRGSRALVRAPSSQALPAAPLQNLTIDDLRRIFNQALDLWGTSIHLSLPTKIRDFSDPPRPDESIAYINLHDRTIHVNYGWLRDHLILDTLVAVYAHEIGHHVRYPATLANAAQLELLESYVWPKGLVHLRRSVNLANLFEDLLINHALVQREPSLAHMFQRIYRANPMPEGGPRPIFGFFLAVQEYAYHLPRHAITGPTPLLDEHMPGWRSRVARFAEAFYLGFADQDYLQYRLFLNVIVPFAKLEEKLSPPRPPPGDPRGPKQGPIATAAGQAAQAAMGIAEGGLWSDTDAAVAIFERASEAAATASGLEERGDTHGALRSAADAAQALAEAAKRAAERGWDPSPMGSPARQRALSRPLNRRRR